MRLKRNLIYIPTTKTHHPRAKKWLFISVPAILFASGLYILINVFSPALPPQSFEISDIEIRENTENPIKENRLYIPEIGVDVLIAQGGAEALEKGAWRRKPDNSDPEKVAILCSLDSSRGARIAIISCSKDSKSPSRV